MEIFIAPTSQPILEFLYFLNPDIVWEQEFFEGRIRVGKHFVGKHYLLSMGDRVIYDPHLEISEPEVNFNYNMIYEDEFIAVIDKPVPLPIHPTGTYFHNTLTRLLSREGKHWYTVHRLDNETSGVFLLSKKMEYTEKLRQSLLKGKKIYLVLTYGLPPIRFIVNMPLGKKEGSKVFKRQGYVPDGKESVTRFHRVGYRWGKDGQIRGLLLAQPLTGRTHQIRAHLCESRFPVVGDKVYGKDEAYFLRHLQGDMTLNSDLEKNLELDRQFLHCRSITIDHPFMEKRIRFRADWPAILKDYWKRLRK